MARVLLVLSEAEVRGEIARLLSRQGHDVVESPGTPDCVEQVRTRRPQVAVAEDAPEALTELLRAAPSLPVVVCLEARSAARAMELMRQGAFDCVPPPWTGEALGAPIRRALRVQGTAYGFEWKPEPKPRVPRWARWAAAAAAAALVSAAVSWRLFGPKGGPEPTSSRTLPYRHPAGAAWKDGLWVTDWFTQALYRHKSDLSIEQVYTLPGGTTPGAVAFAEGSAFLAVGGRRWLKAAPSQTLTPAGEFQAPGPRTVGLCYDGLYLWSADGEEKKLRQHLLDDRLSVVEAYAYPGGRPAALACGPAGLWSLDEDSGELLRHDARRADLVLGRAVLPEYASGVWRPTGLAHDGQGFWSVAERREGEEGRVFRHRDPWAR